MQFLVGRGWMVIIGKKLWQAKEPCIAQQLLQTETTRKWFEEIKLFERWAFLKTG